MILPVGCCYLGMGRGWGGVETLLRTSGECVWEDVTRWLYKETHLGTLPGGRYIGIQITWKRDVPVGRVRRGYLGGNLLWEVFFVFFLVSFLWVNFKQGCNTLRGRVRLLLWGEGGREG